MNIDARQLPDTDHVARYCKPGCVDQYDDTPLACAFQVRKFETLLSVNWLEYFKTSSEAEAVDRVRAVLRKKLSLKDGGRIAVLNVRDARDATERDLEVTHHPTGNDRSHAGISGYKAKDDWTESFLAGLAAARLVYPAVVLKG